MKNILFLSIILISLGIVNAELPSYLTLEWEYAAKSRLTDVEILDINNDSYMEIIVTSHDGYTYLLDRRGKLIWKHTAYCPVYAVCSSDIFPDAGNEIVVGSCRALEFLNASGKKMKKFSTIDRIEEIVIEDLDADNKSEIIFSSGFFERKHHGLVHIIKITDEDLNIFFSKRIDADKHPQLFVEDLEGDGVSEFIIVGDDKIFVYDFGLEELLTYESKDTISTVKVRDINDDGNKEMIVGTHTGISVIDTAGDELWSYKINSRVGDIHVDDLEGDGEVEILVGSDKLYILSNTGYLTLDYKTDGKVNEVTAGDLDLDGEKEIVIGSEKLQIIDASGSLQLEYDVLGPILYLEVADLDGDGINELVMGADFNFYLFKSMAGSIVEYQADSFLENAVQSYNSGKYTEAKKYLEKSMEISDKWNVGECYRNQKKCDMLLALIEGSPIAGDEDTTSTTIETSTASTMPTTSLEHLKEEYDKPSNNYLPYLLGAVIIAFIIGMYCITKAALHINDGFR